MDYQKIYNDLIQRAQARQPPPIAEKHHIVPKCLGGGDDLTNLACLTPEEHYIAHQLLTKIHPGHKGLAKAAHMMCTGRPTNKYYGWVKRRFVEAQRQSILGENNPAYGTRLIHNLNIRETTRIGKEEPLPEGWSEGAIYDYDGHFDKINKREQKAAARKTARLEKIQRLRELYQIYNTEGFEGVLRTGYNRSKPNLVMQFAKYLPEFVPQNGKKRGAKPPQ